MSGVVWIGVAVLVLLAIAGLVWYLLRRRSGGRSLRDSGERALARVISVEAADAPVGNDRIRCNIAFQLEPLTGGRAFDRQATLTLPQHLVPRLGDVWPAWYRGTDPKAFDVEVPDPANAGQRQIFRDFGLRHPIESQAQDTPSAPPPSQPSQPAPPAPAAPHPTPAPHQTAPQPDPGARPSPAPAAEPPPRVVHSPHEDPVIELERLVRLRDSGSISEEEFAAAKAKYLRG